MPVFYSSQSSDSSDSYDIAAHRLKLGAKVCYGFLLAVYISDPNVTRE